jgi:putative ABC transport system permease protein
MHIIALKMLLGDRAKYLGLIFGIMFATLLMSQQISIFLGVLTRTASQIVDISEANIWVMSPEMKYVDEVKPLSNFDLYKVKGVEGVKWAVPLFKGMGVIKTHDGNMQQIIVLGVDDHSLIGRPPKMLMGNWHDLKQPDALIMDKAGWDYIWPETSPKLGTVVELNERRAKIVGICEATPPFMTFPLVFTKFSNTAKYIPQGRKHMSFVLAKSEAGLSPTQVTQNITKKTRLQALTTDEFRWRSIHHYLTKTGLPINFGITVTLGFIVGATIAAQTFYIFIVENLKQFGALKAIGVTNKQILMMVAMQTIVVAAIGFSIGIGLAALFFESTSNLNAMRGFFLHWEVVVGTAITVLIIMLFASYISIRKVLLIDPATVFRG